MPLKSSGTWRAFRGQNAIYPKTEKSFLNTCINQPFKDMLKEQYTRWMAAGEHKFTPMRKISDQMLSSFVRGSEKHGHAFCPL
jgi:hypothetical protein